MTIPTPQPGVADPGSGTLHPAAEGSRPVRPGWTEVAVAAVTYAALWGLAYVVLHAIPDEHAVANGLVAETFSGLLGLGAFAAAYAVRIRDLRAFGVRRVRWTWLLAGGGLGIVAVFAGNYLAEAYKALTTDTTNVQGGYQAVSTGGPLLLVASLLLGAVATGVGEELAFRGVLTNALGRYRAWVAVPVSAVVFAVPHGFNVIFVVALVNGLIAALLFRRTGSIWPGVCMHLVNNTFASLVPVLLATGS